MPVGLDSLAFIYTNDVTGGWPHNLITNSVHQANRQQPRLPASKKQKPTKKQPKNQKSKKQKAILGLSVTFDKHLMADDDTRMFGIHSAFISHLYYIFRVSARLN